MVVNRQTGNSAVAPTVKVPSLEYHPNQDIVLDRLSGEIFMSKTIKRWEKSSKKFGRLSFYTVCNPLMSILGEFWRSVFEPGVCHVLF